MIDPPSITDVTKYPIPNPEAFKKKEPKITVSMSIGEYDLIREEYLEYEVMRNEYKTIRKVLQNLLYNCTSQDYASPDVPSIHAGSRAAIAIARKALSAKTLEDFCAVDNELFNQWLSS
jgi:hypothetical protein